MYEIQLTMSQDSASILHQSDDHCEYLVGFVIQVSLEAVMRHRQALTLMPLQLPKDRFSSHQHELVQHSHLHFRWKLNVCNAS